MKYFLIALQFLTIFPVEIKQNIEEKDYAKSLNFFPLVGLLMGICLSLVLFILNPLPLPVEAAVLLIILTALSAGLHLDGFADTCDGFCSGVDSKEKILQIMSDSRSGVMGIVGVSCLLILKFSLLMTINRELLWKIIIIMAVFSRWVQTFSCVFLPYVKEKGKAQFFVLYSDKKKVIFNAILVLAGCIVFAGVKILFLLLLSFMAVYMFLLYARSKIGGVTGDIIGAASEITEAGVLFFALILYGADNFFLHN